MEKIPTTALGMERALALAVAGLRIGTLVQMAPALGAGLAVSQRPGVYAVSWGLAAAMALTVSVVALIRQHPVGPRLFAVDAVVAAGLLVLGDLCVPPDMRVGTWVGFQPAYALSVVASGAVIRAAWWWLAGVTAVVAADVYYRVLHVEQAGMSTAIGNILTYVVLAAVTRVAVRYIRRVAADGDLARAEAAELGRREEERRAQLAIHNGAAVMRLLADPDLGEEVRDGLRREADIEVRRMRSYLQGEQQPGSGSSPQDLASWLRATAQRFDDLPLTVTVDLAEGVPVSSELAAALDHAVAALLLNVREHADADTVVLHADAAPAAAGATRWIVTLHDDGRGFDADPGHWGVGLREVSHEQLRRHDVTFELSSTRGRGSTAVLTGVATESGGENVG
ncbi:hypothetical protein [Pseudactinotalea sp.]|uniref:hypothetical protein n=1 Tax=Pseudactinotalea sp. TaxID=1926260 RepID=UPI003B3ACC73